VLTRSLGSVEYSYGAIDMSGVAAYDVQLRRARAGRGFDGWTSPGGWSGTTSTTQVAAARPGEQVCFRVRAVDGAGLRTAWSDPACSAVPWDDTSLNVGGPSKRRAEDAAFGGTVLQLKRPGSSAWIPRQTGRQVAVLVWRGPKQGSLDVFAGSERLGRIKLKARSWRLAVVHLDADRTWKGEVRLVAVRGPARIDGVAVLR
jgi:hypothetical protein